MTTKIRPLQDRIIVKRVQEEEKTKGGIIIPDSAKEKPIEGKVIAVGNGKVLEDGKVRPLDVKAGDRVLFSKYAGHRDQDRRRGAPHHARGRHPRRDRRLARVASPTSQERSTKNGCQGNLFDQKARDAILKGVNTLADAVKVTLGPEGPQRRHREELRLPDHHQGRRDGREGDRAREQVREHGRADGEGGRLQDLRRRRRRHHHRDRARPGDLPRGLEARRGRPQPDGHQARHRQGRRDHRRRAEEALEADQGPQGDRPGRHHLRERRHHHRQHHRRGDGEGRQGGRHHRRGGQGPRDDARGGRGHAVRPRLPLALLRDRRRADGGGPRGRLHPHQREEDLEHEGPAPAARADRALGQAAPHRGRGGRGRGARDARRQQAPRHAARLRA